MAAANLIETHTIGAEIYHGKVICMEKMVKLLVEFSLPTGLLQLGEVDEIGLNRAAGFLWIKQKKKNEHTFKKIGETIIYEALITAFIEPKHLAKVTGVKVNKLFVPLAMDDILAGSPSGDKIKFTSAVGLSTAHPISCFEAHRRSKIIIFKIVAPIQDDNFKEVLYDPHQH